MVGFFLMSFFFLPEIYYLVANAKEEIMLFSDWFLNLKYIRAAFVHVDFWSLCRRVFRILRRDVRCQDSVNGSKFVGLDFVRLADGRGNRQTLTNQF